MPSATHTVVVARPLDDVHAFLTEPANDRRWRPAVQSIEAEGPLAVGVRIHQTVAGPAGRGIPADIAVTELTPTSYAFIGVSGPVRPVGRYTRREVAGGTEVSFSLNTELNGFKRLAMSRPVQRAMEEEVAALDKARAILEGA